ncbi:ABC transporter permease [Nonomuraea sp. H19]|uniref:ABC transporter permease n=1 Tax=Nonomuraea sp. H19 TaxID=3452206 RepID=UPI003F8AC449
MSTPTSDGAPSPTMQDHPLMAQAAPAKRTPEASAPGPFGGWLRLVRGRGALEIGIIFALVQIGCVVAYLVAPDSFPYLSEANFNVLSQSIPVLAILAIGAGVLMIAGEFDLSLGMNYTFCALVFIHWYSDGNVAGAFVVTFAMGIGIALLNGVIVTRFKIPSFIVTLGMMLFWDGAALFYNGTSAARMQRGETLQTVFAGQVGPFRGQVVWLVLVAVFFWVLMHRHKLGNHIFAVGGNESAARAISINPTRIKLIAFGILGLCVALAAILVAVRTQSVQPGTGRGMELQAIAAAVVGGVALRGGKGSVLGMVLGAALILVLQDILLLSGAPGFYLNLFIGVIIVFAAVFNRLIEGKAE